jgi:hypothetical protein
MVKSVQKGQSRVGDESGIGVDMPRMHTGILLVLATLALACVSPAQTAAKAPPQTRLHQRHHQRKPELKPLVLPPLPSGPLAQLPMDQIPAAPPKVGFENGLLTIVAQNSTLSDILYDVRKLTGASIDIPSNATERVVTRLGPGTPRDVLVSLLNGSSFNYVMVGSNSDPNGVTDIVLTAKPGGGPQAQTVANVYQPNQGYVAPQQPQPFVAQQVPPQPVPGQPPPAVGDENANAEEQDPPDENAEQGQTDANTVVQPDQPPQPGQPNAGPRTPEQILEMLRRGQQPPNAVPNQRPPQEN